MAAAVGVVLRVPPRSLLYGVFSSGEVTHAEPQKTRSQRKRRRRGSSPQKEEIIKGLPTSQILNSSGFPGRLRFEKLIER